MFPEVKSRLKDLILLLRNSFLKWLKQKPQPVLLLSSLNIVLYLVCLFHTKRQLRKTFVVSLAAWSQPHWLPGSFCTRPKNNPPHSLVKITVCLCFTSLLVPIGPARSNVSFIGPQRSQRDDSVCIRLHDKKIRSTRFSVYKKKSNKRREKDNLTMTTDWG